MDWKEARRLRRRLRIKGVSWARYAQCNPRYPSELCRGKRIPPGTRQRLVVVLRQLSAIARAHAVPVDFNHPKIRRLLKVRA